MADAWGIEHRYEDALGEERRVAPETVERLREVVGREPEGDPPVLLVRPGDRERVGWAEVELEDGGRFEVRDRLPAGLPLGYHRLRSEDGRERRLIVSPGRCHLPARRMWGWAAQLYAARSTESWGIGDLADLRRLAGWSAGLGAGFLMVNPLHAVAPAEPLQPSPYFPTSRRFRNPLHLRVEEVPGAAGLGAALDRLAAAGRSLNAARRIDRDAVWRLKREALEAVWERTGGGAGFEAWWAGAGDGLRTFATWCALAERHGPSWRAWPARLRHPARPEVAEAGRELDGRVRFHAWLQWLCERQLEAAGEALDVVQDLPIGVDPDGADAWAWQDLLAQGVSVGAPPDAFNTQGQDWGLPPFIPWRLRDAAYEPFAETIRATIGGGAGGLRVDHVMGLFRLWWIPDGAGARDGAYVRSYADDLLDIVALESHRAGAVVVGEDLGTVEEAAREAMAERGMLSYRLLWFEEDDPAGWPERAMAAVTTHDLPTVAGLWDGSDLEEQRRLGMRPNEEGTEAIRRRLAGSGGLDEGAGADEAVEAAHRLLARAPALLLAATLDDALAVPERPNVPGADGGRDNWSIALPAPLEEIERHPLTGRVAALLDDAVTAPTHLRRETRA